MIKADRYIKEIIEEILTHGSIDKNPRPKWGDGTPAHTKYVTQKVFKYNILKSEFPITTLRKTALKGAFYDIEAIYIKQTNIIEEMHPSIHPWWVDFSRFDSIISGGVSFIDNSSNLKYRTIRTIGQTYGHTVRRYDLMNKLLDGMTNNPFSRRHILNLWQEQQMLDDPQALVPCAYMTNWNIREVGEGREVDMTLHQRSQDFCMTASINPAQYVMLGMMVCGHLTYKTGIEHKLANFMHIVENCHIYDRHINGAKEILAREPILIQPSMYLDCEPKNFYDYTLEDFVFVTPKGIEPLSEKLEIAI